MTYDQTMIYDPTMFKDPPETGNETEIAIRVSWQEKHRIFQLAAKHESMGAFIIALIAQENERQITEGVLNIFYDGMPF